MIGPGFDEAVSEEECRRVIKMFNLSQNLTFAAGLFSRSARRLHWRGHSHCGLGINDT
jgi:hypothetical protein